MTKKPRDIKKYAKAIAKSRVIQEKWPGTTAKEVERIITDYEKWVEEVIAHKLSVRRG
jgi:hypothetical protein